MTDRRRHALSIIHGTIYGDLVDASAWGAFAAASGSSFVPDVAPEWLITGTANDYSPIALSAPLTVTTPIDMISWTISGTAAVDLTAPWRNCLALYSRL